MDRREYLAAVALTGGLGSAGCTDSIPVIGNDSGTALGPPDQSRGDPTHPIHGEEFPPFELPDPFAGTTVSSEALQGTAYVFTFVYTSCTDQCGTIMQLLRLIQADGDEHDYDDDIELLAMTFDPDTDTPTELRRYAGLFDMDPTAGNFRFLRPETTAKALDIVNDKFGVPAEVYDANSDKEGAGIHYYILFLVNEEGIVERSYPNVVGAREDVRPNAILEDVRAVLQ